MGGMTLSMVCPLYDVTEYKVYQIAHCNIVHYVWCDIVQDVTKFMVKPSIYDDLVQCLT